MFSFKITIPEFVFYFEIIATDRQKWIQIFYLMELQRYNNGTIDGAFLKVKYASVKETSTEHFFIFIVCLLSRL